MDEMFLCFIFFMLSDKTYILSCRCWSSARFVPQGDDITGELEENLERLTLDIPNADIDDLLTRYQRSMAGVPSRFSRLLHSVA